MAIVFFDYDGTLVDESVQIYRPTPVTLKAVEELQKNGHYAVLATGRAKSYVPDCGIAWDGMITSNGAYAEIAGGVVYDNRVPVKLIRELIDCSSELGFIYVLENQDVCYTNGFSNDHFMETLEHFDISRKNFRPVEEAAELRANKMFLTYEHEEMLGKLQELFRGRFVLGKHRSNMSCDCDVIGSNKGIGIDRIAAAAGLPVSETYALGDGINDYEILRNVGHGIAMGIHVPQLEKVCEYITADVKSEGAAKALAHYKLIKKFI